MKLHTIPCSPSKTKYSTSDVFYFFNSLIIKKKLQAYTNEVPILMHFQLTIIHCGKIRITMLLIPKSKNTQ